MNYNNRKQQIQEHIDAIKGGKTHDAAPSIILEAALLLEQIEDYDLALNIIEQGLESHPHAIDLAIERVKLLVITDQLERVETLLPALPQERLTVKLIWVEYYLTLCPHLPENREKKLQEQALSLIEELCQNKDFNVDTAMSICSILWGNMTASYILAFLDQAIPQIKDEDTSELTIEYCIACRTEGKIERALEIILALTQSHPSLIEAWAELGNCYNILNRHEDAIAAFTQAYELNRANFPALIALINSYVEIKAFKQATKLLFEHLDSYEEYASLFIKLIDNLIDDDKMDEALYFLHILHADYPQQADILIRIAFCEQDLGNTPQALTYAQQAHVLAPNNLNVLEVLGSLYAQTEDYIKALATYNHCLAIEPNRINLLITAGDLCEKDNNFEQAIAYYRRAHKLKPYDIKICFRLLLSYYCAQQIEAATELYQEIHQIIDLAKSNSLSLTAKECEEIRLSQKAMESLRKILSDMIQQNDQGKPYPPSNLSHHML